MGTTHERLSKKIFVYSPSLHASIDREEKRKKNRKRRRAKKLRRVWRKNRGRKGYFNEEKTWQILRYQAFDKHGYRCLCCGRKPPEVVLHVDHIKPKSKYPHLRHCISNLQVLCEDCNIGKSDIYETDHRVNKE